MTTKKKTKRDSSTHVRNEAKVSKFQTNLQATALQSLFMLGETSKPFFVCMVCGEQIPTRHKVKYRYDLKITQHDASSRAMVMAGRRHCRQRHDDTWVWNILPDCGTSVIVEHNDMNSQSPLDTLIHQATKMASTKAHSPTNLDINQFVCAFCEKITYAKCWLRFCPRTYRILKSRADRSNLRDQAIERLDEILVSSKKHMRSESFQNTVDEYGFEPLLNLQQLFFVQMGRYKRCNIFVEPELYQRLKELPQSE
jgi:hypothetical protein